MLHAEIKYCVDDAVGTFKLNVEPNVEGLAVTLTGPVVAETRQVPQYQPWGESGFAMLAKALSAFSYELACEDGMFTGAEMRISPTNAAAEDGGVKSYCTATLTCSATSNRLSVNGPVLRMTRPVKGLEIPDNLYGLLRFLLTACDSTIDKSEPLTLPVPTYSRPDGSDAFVFICELPDAVRPWFITHANFTNPGALQRDGQTATAKAFADFCAGVPA
jgi:hypothetical protein